MGRTISLHDTRTGQVLPVQPRPGNRVGIYACGPTVYGRIHVGNARPYVVFSLLKRLFVHEGYNVTFVTNITDVNDKIYAAAQTAGVGSEQLAGDMIDSYVADTDRLDLGRPDHEPLASATIAEIVDLIETLIEGGHAYAVEGDVYFSVRSYPEYGELSHRDIDELDQGEGVEGAERKRDPADFALWKAQKPGEDTAWDAPWGRGRPGWHIECSAMAEKLLGVGFEIHGGGADLIFPHHENEAAQTTAARDAPLARLWVHNGMIRLDDTKMSKSVGNIFLLHQALDAFGRDALIMYFVGTDYRKPVEFDDERLTEAQARVDRFREAARRLTLGPSPDWSASLHERFFDALANDFNTPEALAAAFEWVREANRAPAGAGDADLRDMLSVLGLENLLDVADTEAPAEVIELRDAREQARAARDYAEADRLREAIRAHGWEVRDSADGPELLPA
ncbi:MAG TPA: cysteine--tRNA ligase [Solirubrobacteraceae bacterium]|nr:cysteine--tRNA ligase [Solirubrobacteraceae bacterium]